MQQLNGSSPLSHPLVLVHSIPGRLRARLSAVDAQQGAELARRLEGGRAGVSARWSAPARSLTLTYPSERSLAEVAAWLPGPLVAVSEEAPEPGLDLVAVTGAAVSVAAAATAADLPLKILAAAAQGSLLRSLALEVLEIALTLALGELVGLAVAALLGSLLGRRSQPAAGRRIQATALAAAA